MSKGKILIVDDDRTTTSVIQLYLRELDYEVAGVAINGREAIEMSRKLEPHLVLMDIRLGKGLDGIDAAEIIYRHFKIPVVFVTSYSDEATLDRAKLINPLGYINKPLRETDLKTTLELALTKINPDIPQKVRKKMSIESVLQSLYDLTPAEARVATKLIEYSQLKSAAEALNISPLTARTHLKKIFRKTNTNRQSSLVQKIITGPAGLLLNKEDF
jgi:DNA-binding NarL/FixJ family response regulator